MYKSSDGKSYHNPAVGREHDRNAAAGKAPGKTRSAGAAEPQEHDGGGDHGEVHKVEIHHPDGAENPNPGKHHTVTTHEDGHEEHMDHGSAEEAHAHVAPEGGDEGLNAESGEDMGGPEEETCPECGAAMDGETCPECGYSADDHAIQGEPEEDAGDHEYR